MERERIMHGQIAMPSLLENLRFLDVAQGYSTLGLFMQSNRELEQMSADTRHWPEVLAVKLAIFDGLLLWEMVEIVAAQLADSAKGNPRWLSLAKTAREQTREARQREFTVGSQSANRSRMTFA